MAKPLIYAHRGGAGNFPEHTLEAYKNCLNLDVDALDIDVQITKDGQIIGYHDQKLNPNYTRDEHGAWIIHQTKIKDLDLSEIKRLDIGQTNRNSRYFKHTYPQQSNLENAQILTLEEIIDFVENNSHKNNLIYQIEIKTTPRTHPKDSDYKIIIDKIINILKNKNVLDRSELQSFDWRGLLYAKQLSSNIKTSFITEKRLFFDNTVIKDFKKPSYTAGFDINKFSSLQDMMAKLGADNWCPYYKNLTPENIELAHQLGLKIIPWTVDKPKDINKVILLGVDGIITNRPDLIA